MEINNLDFGQDSAESERDNLRYIFLSTPIYKRLISTNKWLVLGRKGAGKTAMCQMFFEQNSKQKPITLLSPRSLSVSHAILLDKASINSDESATQKWKLVFLLEASRYIVYWASEKFGKNYTKWAKPLQKVRLFLINHDESRANPIDKAFKFIRSISKVAISVLKIEGSLEIDKQTQNGNTLSDDIDTIFPVIKNAANMFSPNSIYFLVDQVDDLWDSSKDGQDLIIGLLRAAKEINDVSGFIKTIVFLRSDIFGYLRFPNSDHFRSHTEYLEWDVDSLKSLIELRIHNSTNLNRNTDELWKNIFPSTINGIDSFKFIVEYTLMRPRELIQLCNLCKDIALNRNSNQISPVDALKAIDKYSIWKSEDLISEYYVQYPFLEKILLGIFYASPSYEITREKIEQLFNTFKDDLIKQYGSKYFDPIDVLLQSLYGIGFLGAVHHTQVLYEVLGDKVIIPHANLFHVHRAFRSGLRIPDANIDFSKAEKETRDLENKNNYREMIYGDGAIAQGSGSKAVGKGGIMISGDVSGNIVIGNSNDDSNKDGKKRK